MQGVALMLNQQWHVSTLMTGDLTGARGLWGFVAGVCARLNSPAQKAVSMRSPTRAGQESEYASTNTDCLQ
jgi:hypothetical protein